MPALANTFTSDDANVNREELSNIVDRITPEDTPIYTLIGSGTCKSTHPEWAVDELRPPADNFQLEGDEYTFDESDPVSRYGNYAQIMRASWVFSKTQEAVDNAGRVEKIREKKLKAGIEIRKDVEFAIVGNQASVATDPRKFGSLPTWYETNVNRGAGGTNGGFNVATGLTVAAGTGTQRAFSKALLDDVMQQVYNSGGNVKYAVVSPYVKRVFTTFMSDTDVASYRYAASETNNAIISSADIYVGDFGKMYITPNRVMGADAFRASNVHLLDTSKVSFDWLRKLMSAKTSPTGDAEKGVIIGEGTLRVKNEQGLGVVADVFGLSATT